MSKVTLSTGFSKEQIIAATPSASVKGMVFNEGDKLSFLSATAEARVNDASETYEVVEANYAGASGNVRIPLSELIRMKTADNSSIISVNAEGDTTPPQTITINKSEGRLRKGIVRGETNKAADFMYPTNAYNAAEEMFDEDSGVKFNYNKLIVSGLVSGVKHTPIQDYTVTLG